MNKYLLALALLPLCGCRNLEPVPPEPVVADFPAIDADGEWTMIPLEQYVPAKAQPPMPGAPGKPVEVRE